MRNVTISLDEDLARWARVKAAERDSSLSAFIAAILAEERESESTYEQAMQRHFQRETFQLRESPESPLPTREETYAAR